MYLRTDFLTSYIKVLFSHSINITAFKFINNTITKNVKSIVLTGILFMHVYTATITLTPQVIIQYLDRFT